MALDYFANWLRFLRYLDPLISTLNFHPIFLNPCLHMALLLNRFLDRRKFLMLEQKPNVIRVIRVDFDTLINFFGAKEVVASWRVEFEIPHFIYNGRPFSLKFIILTKIIFVMGVRPDRRLRLSSPREAASCRGHSNRFSNRRRTGPTDFQARLP